MKIGILKDIKEGEYRVIATPCEVATLIDDGNEVFVQREAGSRAGFDDSEYAEAGAKLLETKEEIYATCDMVAKVKEIEPCEYDLLREDQIIYTCIHPAAHPEELQARRCWITRSSPLPPRIPIVTDPPTARLPERPVPSWDCTP